jgi:hypothetical protein
MWSTQICDQWVELMGNSFQETLYTLKGIVPQTAYSFLILADEQITDISDGFFSVTNNGHS